MELRHLRHFVALAEELSFSRAAQRLNMAQPPLSQSIRRLEESLGVQLFDRTSRGVELTRAGCAFLDEARVALQHADLARKLARREAEPVPEVRLSFITAAMYRFLPGLLRRFGENTPDFHVRLFEMHSPLQVAPVLAGDCDVAFVGSGTKGFEDCEKLVVDRSLLAAVVPAHWPIATLDSISLAELAEYPFILPPSAVYSEDAEALLGLFRKAGVMPQLTQSITHVSTTFRLVAAGLGCTITTASACLVHPLDVCFVPLSDNSLSFNHDITMVWLPGQLTQAARKFVSFAAATVQGQVAEPRV